MLLNASVLTTKNVWADDILGKFVVQFAISYLITNIADNTKTLTLGSKAKSHNNTTK